MALTDNPFVGVPLARLQTMQELYITAVEEIATTGQNYTAVSGRSFAAADLEKIKTTLFQITQAIGKATHSGNPRAATPKIIRN